MQQDSSQRYTRVSVNIPAEYVFKSNRGDCTIVDFSEGGIAIEANQIFVEGDTINIRFEPSNNLHFDMWCVVRNITGRKVGMSFEEISNEQRKKLENYIYTLLDSNNKNRFEPIS